jgi:hypothetical protein
MKWSAVSSINGKTIICALPHLQAYYARLGYRVVRYVAHAGYTAPTSVLMEKDVV